MQKPVTIYTTDTCVYCRRAKKIMAAQGIAYSEVNVTDDDVKRAWLVDTTGQRTVPQIFFGDDSIGGCDDLEALINSGGLEDRLTSRPIKATSTA